MLYVPRVIFAVLADAVKIHRVIFDRTSEIFRCYVLDFTDVTHCKVCHAVTFSANEMVMRGSISIEPVRADTSGDFKRLYERNFAENRPETIH